MEIFPKDSFPAPEGWRRRKSGEMKTLNIERTGERHIRDRGQ